MKKLLFIMMLFIISISFSSATLNDGVVTYYKLDNTTGVVIDSLINNNGTNTGATRGVVGKINNSFNFTGTDYVTVADSAELDPSATNNASWNMWVYFNNGAFSANQGLFSKREDVEQNGSYSLIPITTGELNWNMYTASGISQGVSTTNMSLASGQWYMITLTQDSNIGQTKFYKNGVLQETFNTITNDFKDNTHPFYLAAQGQNLGDPGRQLDGRLDEFGFWNSTLSASDISNLYSSGSGITYPFPEIAITLNSPDANFNGLAADSIIFNVTSSSGFGLVNITLNINGSIDETKNISGISNETIFTKLFLSQGLYNWSSVVCDNTSNCLSSETRFFNISNVVFNNITFNNQTTEGATETFSVNFTKSSLKQVSTVDLVYNGTSNSFPYSVTGNNVFSQSSIVISPITSDQNVTFYWNITLSDGTSVISDSNNQSISNINIDDCSSFTNVLYNFTMYDEESTSKLGNDTTMEVQINLYDTSRTLLLINFSKTYSNINPARVCLEDELLTTVNYSSYVVVKYLGNVSSNVYSVEYHNILNQTISNTTIPFNIALYALKQDDTTKFRLTFRDGFYNLAPNILVRVYRQYVSDNDFKIVEIPLTDSNGQTILNLVRNDVVYNFIMVNESGEVVGTFNKVIAFCQDFSIGDCTINLAPDALSEPSYNYDEEFDISISEPTYSNNTKLISINFLTGDLSSKTVRMETFRNNDFGNRSVCTDSLTAASGVLRCNVSAITDSDQFLFIYVYVDGELATQYTINLNAELFNLGLNGAFFAFLFVLTIICLFMEDKRALLISLGLGWIIIISLGLINGKLIGASSAGIWFIISIAIFLWKLNDKEGA